MFQDISSKKKIFKIFQTDRKILTCHLVCCNFSKSQGGKIQILLELSYHSHLKKEGMTAAIVDHRRRGGRSKPYLQYVKLKAKKIFFKCMITTRRGCRTAQHEACLHFLAVNSKSNTRYTVIHLIDDINN